MLIYKYKYAEFVSFPRFLIKNYYENIDFLHED